jgi:glycosyltransferase involved in cell wall biosynthesis
MRVGLIIYGSLGTRSGGYLYDRKLVERLRAAGDEVEIFSQPWQNYPTHLAYNFNANLSRRIIMADLDVLLEDELNHPSLLGLNSLLKRMRGFPVVAIVHHLRSSERHSPLWMPLYRLIERAYLGRLDGMIYNSHTTRFAVEALLGRPAAGQVVTPAGDRLGVRLTLEEICVRNSAPGAPRLLFVGNLIPRKGLDTLLKALTRLRHLDWRLQIAGRQDVDLRYSAAMRRQVSEAGLEERVTFLGSVDDNSLEAELRQAHLLVVPSQYEGFGIVYLEGMAFGLPAVGTAAGGAKEIIQPGVNGLLIDPDDVDGLARGLEQLLVDRPLLLRMSLAARRRFDEFPGWDAGMDAVRSYLTTVCLAG